MSVRRDVAFVMTEYRYSERQACKLLDLDRASYRYEARPDRNLDLRQQLVGLARQKPRFGYRRLWHMLTRSRPELSMSRVISLIWTGPTVITRTGPTL